MQLVDPEDIPAMERLTQEVLLLREKVASVESEGQETSGNRRQQVSYWSTGLIFTAKSAVNKMSVTYDGGCCWNFIENLCSQVPHRGQ